MLIVLLWFCQNISIKEQKCLANLFEEFVFPGGIEIGVHHDYREISWKIYGNIKNEN